MAKKLEGKKTELILELDNIKRNAKILNNFITLWCFSCEDDCSLTKISDFFEIFHSMGETASSLIADIERVSEEIERSA